MINSRSFIEQSKTRGGWNPLSNDKKGGGVELELGIRNFFGAIFPL